MGDGINFFSADFWLNNIWWLLLILLMLILTLRSAVGLTIPSGNCSNLSLGGFVNFSLYPNATGVDVAYWDWTCCEDCTNASNCSVQDIFFELSPGSNISGERDNCRYSFNCLPSNLSCVDTCTVDKLIEPGDNYVLDEGGCDIRVRCAECTPEEEDRSVTLNQSFKITREDGSDVINFYKGEDVYLTLPISKGFSHEFDVSFLCPAYDPVKDLEEHPDLAQEVCYKYQPMVYSHLDLLEKAVASRDDTIQELNTKLSESSVQLGTCENRAGRCAGEQTGRVEALTMQLNTTELLKGECLANNSKLDGEVNSYLWLSIFMFFGMISLGGVALWQHSKLRRVEKNLRGDM